MGADKKIQRKASYCAMCWSSCGCIAVVENDRLVAVEPDPSHPTGKALCSKGLAAPEHVYNGDRLQFPVKRTRPKGDPNPGWERISWDEALNTTAREMERLAADGGSESIAFNITTSAGTAMQDGYPWVERLRRAFGSPNVVASIEICNFTKEFVHPHTFGVGMPMPDFDNTGCIILWGHNPTATWLAFGTRVADARARGAKLVVVDPRRAGLASKADEWLRVRPGSDGALALGIAGVMIDEGLYDRSFVIEWTNGPFLVRQDTGRLLTGADLGNSGDVTMRVAWDEAGNTPVLYDTAKGTYELADVDVALAGTFELDGQHGTIQCQPAFQQYHDLCQQYSPERVEEICWVPAEQVQSTARLLAASGPISLQTWAGVEQHTNSGQNSRAIALLYALTGSFDAKGGNVIFDILPMADITGTELLSEEQQQKTLGLDKRPLGPEKINSWVTTEALYDAILEQKPYSVEGLVSFGSNILVSHSDSARGAKALDSLRFMVHADIFMTPTAEHADIVLPVNTPWEREGIRTNFLVSQKASGHVQMREAAVDPVGESRSDSWIAFALAERLGYSKQFWDGDIDAGYREMLAPSAIELDDLRAAAGGISISLPTSYRKYAGDGDGYVPGFNTPSKRIEVYSEVLADHGYAALPEYVEPAMSGAACPDLAADFPLVLTSAKSPQYLGSQGRAIPALRRIEPDPKVDIHPDTAARRGIGNGEWVALVTPHGRMRVKARYAPHLHPNVVVAIHGWWQANSEMSWPGYDIGGEKGSNLNSLIDTEVVEPIGGAAAHRSYACQIQALEQPYAQGSG